jgi:hypothetical protein
MATEKQIAANRANALLSTGPRTAAGRARSSMNSYRDGMRSRKRKALREESYVAESRKHRWMALSDPCNDIAEFLMHQNVCASFELEHAVRVNMERSNKLVENSDDKEIDAVQALGRRLFHDRCGPTGAYGNLPHVRTNEDRKRHTSSSGKGDDPDDPAKLVAELEKTAAGCIWMREQWEELREQLNRDVFQSIDRFTATRLLGRQPADISFDRDVAVNFVAGEAVDPSGKTEFDDLLSDFREEQVKRLRKKLHKRWPELFEFVEVSPFKQLLGELIDEQIERLRAMEEEFKTNAEEIARAAVAESKHDKTPETYRLLNYVKSARRELRLGIAAFEKYNKGQKDRVESSPRRTKEDDGRMPRRVPLTGGGMAEDVDLAWAYAGETVGDRGASGVGVEGNGPGIDISGCMMSPPLGAPGAEEGEVDGGWPRIDIPGEMMSPPMGAQGWRDEKLASPHRTDHAGIVARRPPVNDPPPQPSPTRGEGFFEASATGSMPPFFETKTLATITANLPDQLQLFISPAQGREAREADGVGPGIDIPAGMMAAPVGAPGDAGGGDGDGPGIGIPGYVESLPEGARDGALAGNDSLGDVAMASAASAVCGGDSVTEVAVTTGGGNVAGETSEPNFDENVLTAKSSVAVDVTANSGAFSGLDKRGEGKGASQNPKSEIRNPKGGLEVQGEANVRGATRDRNPARSIEKPEPHGLSERRSKRERRRIRREMERKEVERRVQKLLMAGETSASKIIEKILSASPRVRKLAGPGALKHDHSQSLGGDGQVDSGRSGTCPQTRPP